MINIPVEIGDIILTGKFKNKVTVIKSIGTDDHGMPTINGKKVVTFRIKKAEKNESINGESKMSEKKQKLDEGLVMISSLLPTGPKLKLSMRGDKPDNFVFKGLPGQFDKDGNKVLDEWGDPIKEEKLNEDKKSFKVWSNDIIRIAKRELDEISYLLQKNNFEVDEDEYTAIFLKKVQKALDSPGVTSKGKSLKRSTLGDLFF